ncbi:CitMHS family transporter [Lacrimispora sp.]|uniref:CitMHS family transporter n=1 Tax=Lacrimispora sp. TaxID=2719234 RepID=UPI003460F570
MNAILAVFGFALIIITMILLMKGKISPVVVLISIPTVIGLLVSYVAAFMGGEVPVGQVFRTVTDFIKTGVGTTMNNAVLLMFSVLFFGVMSDVGVFDVIVDALLKKAGNNVVAITVATSVIAVIGHLDGATVTTVLITIPALYPIYKRLNMRTHTLLALTAASMGVMNLVPWGGPTVRAATVLEMDANELWMSLIPIQAVGLVCSIGLAVILGLAEKKRGAGLASAGSIQADGTKDENVDSKRQELLRPNLVWFNGLLILVLIVSLVFDIAQSYVLFMMALALALIVNYPSMKMQDSRIKSHAAGAILISATMLAAGAFVGILDGTGMLEAMTNVLLSLIPDFLGKYVHIIFGLIGLPLGMVTGTDAYFYGIMPLVIGVGESYGVTGINTALAMLLGKNVSLMISPMVPATFLALGFVDLDLKDHIKFSFKYLYIISVIMVFSGVLLGLIAI